MGAALLKLESIPWAIEETALETMRSIAARAHEITPEALEAYRGKRVDGASPGLTRRDSGVATLEIAGPLFRRADAFDAISGASDTGVLARDFNAALADPEIHSIVLAIDSPGGEVAGIDQLAGMIRMARGTKPIVAHVDGDAASGAYWLASAADRIVMAPAARVGSIGVVCCYVDTKGLQSKTGVIRGEIVSSNAPNKRPDPTTEKGKALIQGQVDDLEQVFIEAVAAGRGVTPEKVAADYGRGSMFIASKAVPLGMADSIGDYESVHAGLVADHEARLEAERRRRMGGFGVDENKGGSSNLDADELRRSLDEAHKLNASLADQIKADARQRDLDARERARERASALAMSYMRADSAKLLPRQRDAFIDLHSALATVDRLNPQVDEAGKTVKLTARLEQLVDSAARHSALDPAEDGSEPDDSSIRQAREALEKVGFRVVGGQPPKPKATDDASDDDLAFARNGRKSG